MTSAGPDAMLRDADTEIGVERDGLVAVVTIDRPPVNFFDVALLDSLLRKMRALDADPDCRAIILAATGKVFCAGADLGTGIDPSEALSIASALYGNALGLFEIATPIVAAVQGPAIGGGLGLALTADFRVASDTARFSGNFALLGMHCGFAISATLPRLVGQQAAARMLFTGERLSGTQAHATGLVDALVAPSEERNAALALAGRIAASAPRAVQDMRATLRRGLTDQFRAALAHELAQQREHMTTADFREGVRAAAERRAPRFVGA